MSNNDLGLNINTNLGKTRLEKRKKAAELQKKKVGKLMRWLVFTVLISFIPVFLSVFAIETSSAVRDNIIKSLNVENNQATQQSTAQHAENTAYTNTKEKNMNFTDIFNYLFGNGTLLVITFGMCGAAAGEMWAVRKKLPEGIQTGLSTGFCIASAAVSLLFYAFVSFHYLVGIQQALDAGQIAVSSAILFGLSMFTGGSCIYISEV